MNRSRPMIYALSMVAALCLSALVQARGTKSDYERAATMRERTANKVLNARLNANWLDDRTMLYRKQTSLKTWRFILVNAETGEKRDAFDHEQAAKHIGAALGEELDPDRLPFDRFSLANGDLTLLVDKAGRVFKLGENGATEVPIGLAEAFLLKRSDDTLSRDHGGEANVLFINNSEMAVDVAWIDREGDLAKYATLKPGDRHRQHTFNGHLWVIKDAEGAEYGRYVAHAGFGVVVINGDKTEPPVEKKEDEEKKSRMTSPDGAWTVEIRGGNVHLIDTETDETVELTTDGANEDYYTQRVMWSPDSKKLMVVRTTPEQKHTVYMVESSPRDQLQPKLHKHQYLKPGDVIAHPRPCLFDIETMTQIAIDDALFPTPWTLSSFDWEADSSAFTFIYNQRGHQVMRLVSVDAATGDVRLLINEEPETFFNYSNKLLLHRNPEARELIWMSERDNWNHLYLLDADTGEVKNQITRGEWVVRSVEKIDDEARRIWFRAMGVYKDQDPYHVQCGRVNYDGTGLTWFTVADGTHTVQYSPDRSFYIDRYERVDLPPVHELRRTSDGALVCELERADWSALLETGWTAPERVVYKARDGKTDIWGIITHPTNFDPTKTYPVIEYIYAGPHDHFVPKNFRVWDQTREVIELGFIVVRIDGMGTNWRSKSFHDVCWRNIGDSGFADRKKWITEAAAVRPYMDISKVGIYGGSAGGQSTVRALTAHADFYHVGVADCGCHDNRMDKIWWNEAWMGWPIGDHYAEQSNVTNAHLLEGKLLLIVGEIDHNVDPASTMQVADALIKADKDFDLIVMTSADHGAAESKYGRRRRQDFFVRYLMGAEPRQNP